MRSGHAAAAVSVGEDAAEQEVSSVPAGEALPVTVMPDGRHALLTDVER